MSENDYNVGRASARLGGLSSYGRTPSPEVEADARRQLATARVDRELRSMSAAGIRLDPSRAAHLAGLLLSTCGVNYDASTVVEATVRAVVEAAQAEESK